VKEVIEQLLLLSTENFIFIENDISSIDYPSEVRDLNPKNVRRPISYKIANPRLWIKAFKALFLLKYCGHYSVHLVTIDL
jgi:hypothetical protein